MIGMHVRFAVEWLKECLYSMTDSVVVQMCTYFTVSCPPPPPNPPTSACCRHLGLLPRWGCWKYPVLLLWLGWILQTPVLALVGNDAGWTQIAREQAPLFGSSVACDLAVSGLCCVCVNVCVCVCECVYSVCVCERERVCVCLWPQIYFWAMMWASLPYQCGILGW